MKVPTRPGRPLTDAAQLTTAGVCVLTPTRLYQALAPKWNQSKSPARIGLMPGFNPPGSSAAATGQTILGPPLAAGQMMPQEYLTRPPE
jgi:hypothetical protein